MSNANNVIPSLSEFDFEKVRFEAVRINGKEIRVFKSLFGFGDAGFAYGETQTSDYLRDGDILIFAGYNVIILNRAWPVLAFGDFEEVKEFHQLEEGFSFETLDDGKYRESFAVAKFIYEREIKKEREYSFRISLAEADSNPHNFNNDRFEKVKANTLSEAKGKLNLAPGETILSFYEPKKI